MSKKLRKTKISLLCCSLAIIITIMLFYGSTLAWFADSDALVNTFTLGNLGVDVVRIKSTDGEYVSVRSQTVPFIRIGDTFENAPGDIIFEPGATFMLPTLYVKNTGDIPLNYKLKILDTTDSPINLVLMEALDFYVKIGEEKITDIPSFSARVEEEKLSEPIVIFVHMKESAGNKYQGLCLSNVVVEFYAYQDGMYENSVLDWYNTGIVPED